MSEVTCLVLPSYKHGKVNLKMFGSRGFGNESSIIYDSRTFFYKPDTII